MSGQGRDCVVLGCGRSGTSLVAGILSDSGWDLGERLLAANADNRTGYFESLTVNRLNERLLAPATAEVPADGDGRPLASRPLREGERWLAALPADVVLPAQPDLDAELAAALRSRHGGPVCRKDPRFTWTLPLWPLDDALRVVVFREPLAAARSMAAMAGQGDLGLGLEGALAVWAACGRRALARADLFPQRWTFVSYASVLDGTALPGLAAALGVDRLDSRRVDRSLQHQPATGDLPDEVADLYAELLERAARHADAVQEPVPERRTA